MRVPQVNANMLRRGSDSREELGPVSIAHTAKGAAPL